ncbi:hypothetical protein ZWY2020_036758 [Hordeum vulgare]|nr:hypothetical protein ZWY2020_036758 [Hordeum vulgare]
MAAHHLRSPPPTRLQKPGDAIPAKHRTPSTLPPPCLSLAKTPLSTGYLVHVRTNENMALQSRTAAVALLLIAVVVAAASVPAATAFGCFDDCYERCANGAKEDPACTKMCGEACGVAGKVVGGAAAGVVGAGASAGGAGAATPTA